MATPTPDPMVLTVLVYATLAAVSAALGTLPFSGRSSVHPMLIALAYALASGMMLGAGYILLTAGVEREHLPVLVGAGLGVLYTFWTHRYSGTSETEGGAVDQVDPGHSINVVLLTALHSASEGVAIGVAMVVGVKLGVFIAVTLAVHNIAEAMGLTSVLRATGTPLGRAAGLSVVTRVPQILLAIVVFAVTPAVPGLVLWALGFAAGAMVYLVLTELLPHSYERTGRTRIALLVSLATGVIVLLKGFIV